jgi:DNA-binding GntR family transcriptional regulator
VEPIQHESLVTVAAARLRDAILKGEMNPGEAIPVRALQESLGISHIPIREALRQLEAEGLVVVPPRRMPMVAGVALEELSAIYELRKMIEIPTARRAIENAKPADAVRVGRAFEEFARHAEDTRAPEYWEAHTRFHWALIETGANAWTRRILERLWRTNERYVRLFVSTFGSPEDAMRLHVQLLEAFESGDADRLAEAFEVHFDETERVVCEGYLASTRQHSPA